MFNTKILEVHENFIKATKKLNKFVEEKDEEKFI
jgi:prephenate dehydrogenase